MSASSPGWRFIDDQGSFALPDPHQTSYLYFPLVNEAGMMSVISPTLNGDIKTSQHAFLTLPVSVEDLHNSRAARNVWVSVEGSGPWSVGGNSAAQVAQQFNGKKEEVTLEAGFLWHKTIRQNSDIGLRAEVTNLVPTGDKPVELMKVVLTNITQRELRLTTTAAIPIYGRSADNVRDHRHVTSLLHRIRCHPHGVLVKPTLSFDERGHSPNSLTYAILGSDGAGRPPAGFFPLVEEFTGEGGVLDWPEAVVKSLSPRFKAGEAFEGYEALGGLRFPETTLAPGGSQTCVLILTILDEGADADELVKAYGSAALFDAALDRTQADWRNRLSTLAFQTGDARFNSWLKWVALQPTLRRLFGNSFLPYHDYGRGGRGWRDLWQDVLALLLMEPGDVSGLLYGNFAGVRIDGSNATIIGNRPGEFKADRNNIPRVWMDHGAWPLLTTRLYIDQTGDLDFLLREQTYFKDQLSHRAQKTDDAWQSDQGTLLRTAAGEVYRGTILEHLLIQHLTPFYHVGEHNLIRLEGADWNDGMDMARTRGESVAFTAMYAGHLRQLGELVSQLEKQGVKQIEIAAEMGPLFEPLNDMSVESKRNRLVAYFESCRHTLAGAKISLPPRRLAEDLTAKADWLEEHIRTQEWIKNQAGFAWFNGYYDNDGQRVEGDHAKGTRMTLTGQVFALMGGIATPEQAEAIVRAADRYLFDPQIGGYRLNTNFGEVLLNLGRCFGYAFGHKENGAMFSHMAVMYAYALYQRGLTHAGHKVLDGIYQHSQNFALSRMYPGIPEYISAKGRGMYPYLTGSASWYLLTEVTQVFGVKGQWGNLSLSPKLVLSQFDEKGQAGLKTLFAGKSLNVVYHNPKHLDYGAYQIESVQLNGKDAPFQRQGQTVILDRASLAALPDDQTHLLEVRLG